MCPPRSDNGCPQSQHALVDAVIGRSRDVPGSLPTARKPVHPPAPDFPSQCVGDRFGWATLNAETVLAQSIDQFGDGRRPFLRQAQGEDITEFDTSEAELIHRQTVTRPSDIDRDCRCEAGKLDAAAPRGAWGGRESAHRPRRYHFARYRRYRLT